MKTIRPVRAQRVPAEGREEEREMDDKKGYTVVFRDPHPIFGGQTRMIRFADNREEVIAWAKKETFDCGVSGIKTEILNYRGDTVWESK